MSALGSVVGHSLDDSEVADSSSLSSRESGNFTQAGPSVDSFDLQRRKGKIKGLYSGTTNEHSPNLSFSGTSVNSNASGSNDSKALLLSSASSKKKFPKGKGKGKASDEPRNLLKKRPPSGQMALPPANELEKLPNRGRPYVERDPSTGALTIDLAGDPTSEASRAFNHIIHTRMDQKNIPGDNIPRDKGTTKDKIIAASQLAGLALLRGHRPTKSGISKALKEQTDPKGP